MAPLLFQEVSRYECRRERANRRRTRVLPAGIGRAAAANGRRSGSERRELAPPPGKIVTCAPESGDVPPAVAGSP